MFPHRPHSPSSPAVGVQLRTTDGSPSDTYGNRRIALQFGSRRFDWNFLLAEISVPILQHFHLLVDIAGSGLLDATTLKAQ